MKKDRSDRKVLDYKYRISWSWIYLDCSWIKNWILRGHEPVGNHTGHDLTRHPEGLFLGCWLVWSATEQRQRQPDLHYTLIVFFVVVAVAEVHRRSHIWRSHDILVFSTLLVSGTDGSERGEEVKDILFL